MKAQKDDPPINARPGGWIRIALIGRNPRFTVARIVVFVLTCIVIFRFILLPIRVEGISMFPAYKDGSIHLVNRLAFMRHEPRRGDVVGISVGAANRPFHTPGVMYMKRIVGLPGETLGFAHGQSFINGIALDEPYLKGPCDWNAAPVIIATNQYYVVGDNRSMPWEYHYKGRVEKDQIVGKVLY